MYQQKSLVLIFPITDTRAYASVLEAGSYTVTDLADQAKFQPSFKTSL